MGDQLEAAVTVQERGDNDGWQRDGRMRCTQEMVREEWTEFGY